MGSKAVSLAPYCSKVLYEYIIEKKYRGGFKHRKVRAVI